MLQNPNKLSSKPKAMDARQLVIVHPRHPEYGLLKDGIWLGFWEVLNA